MTGGRKAAIRTLMVKPSEFFTLGSDERVLSAEFSDNGRVYVLVLREVPGA